MKRLGSLLTELGWINPEQLDHALQMQEVLGDRLGTNLLELGAISEERLQTALAHQLRVPAARTRDLRNIPPEVHQLVPSRLAKRWQAVPFRMLGGELHVAMLSVGELDFIGELAFATGKDIRPYVGNEARIACSLEDHYLIAAPRRIRELVAGLDRAAAERAARQVDGLWSPRARETTSPESPGPSSPEALGTAPAHPPERQGREDAMASDEVRAREVSIEDLITRLERLDDRDRVARAILDFLLPHFRRVVLYKLARGFARGWLGAGPGIDTAALRRLRVDLSQPSVLFNLAHGAPHHLGTLPATPAHEEMATGWGGGLPGDCIVLGIRVNQRLVCAILCQPGYAAVRPEARQFSIAQLSDVCAAAGQAFERCVMRRREFATGGAGSSRSAPRPRSAKALETAPQLVDNLSPPG